MKVTWDGLTTALLNTLALISCTWVFGAILTVGVAAMLDSTPMLSTLTEDHLLGFVSGVLMMGAIAAYVVMAFCFAAAVLLIGSLCFEIVRRLHLYTRKRLVNAEEMHTA
jgi:hypothetical protein